MMRAEKDLKRDIRFDYLKGISMCIIVIGHVMQHTIPDYSSTLLFNIIWSLQIPAFMVMSGYFSVTKRTFGEKVLRKSIHYLIPFFSYYLLHCYISNINAFNSIGKLVNHLEMSLWYIFVLYVLSLVGDISQLVALTITKNQRSSSYIVLYTICFFALIMIWIPVVMIKGTTFLGAKYNLYYSVFFWGGWLFRTISKEKIIDIKTGILAKFERVIFAVIFVIYSLIILKVNLMQTEDTLWGIVPRFIGSVFGVYILFYIVINYSEMWTESFITKSIKLIGQWSLEIYFVHMLLVTNLIKINEVAISVDGIITICVNTIFVMATSIGIIYLVKKSSILDLVVFGNIPKR